MAKNLSHPWTEQNDQVEVVGSFAPNGSSAVSAASNKGVGFSVARTSAGLFTITFTERYYDLIHFSASLQLASGGDQYCQSGTWTAATATAAATMTVRVWDASDAAVADVAANANNRINFRAVFTRTATGV